MERIITATEARIRLGEWMRRAVEQNETIIVHRGGKPYIALLSFDAYQRLQQKSQPDWEQTVEKIAALGERWRRERGQRPLKPSPEEVVRQMREERDAQLGLP